MVEKKLIKLVYPELSYKIAGILFDVYNNLGYGYQEKYYQRSVANELKRGKIKFREQVSLPINFKESAIGRYFLDFLIEDKIIVEIKRHDIFHKRDIQQIYAYLKHFKLKLGLLVSFTKEDVRFKRIVNLD
jgi:GxxExxY protein